jgi:hypothetical protein
MTEGHVTEIVGFTPVGETGEAFRRVICSCGYGGQWTTPEKADDERWLHETLAHVDDPTPPPQA